MINFFKKNWVAIVIYIAAFVLMTIFINNQTAAFKHEVQSLHEKLDFMQTGIDARWTAVEGIDDDLGRLTAALSDIDAALDAGETRFNQFADRLGDIQDRLKIEPEPLSFTALENCQKGYNDLYADFKLTHAAFEQKAIDFGLCIHKAGILEDKVGLLEDRNIEITSIAEAHRQQYLTTYDTLMKIQKKYKWRAVGGGILDMGTLAAAGNLASHGKWKQAVGVIAGRYILKLLAKI